MPPPLIDTEIARLRQTHYNAGVISLRRCHDDLLVMRVRTDEPPPRWIPGQYVLLGLGGWEPRAPGTQPEIPDDQRLQSIIRRPYSVSASILNDRGLLQFPPDAPDLEFYITLVRQGHQAAPELTPRLFGLMPGSRLQVGHKFSGRFTLEHISADCDVLFFATGTGEAPHNAMIAELLCREHPGQIVSAVCVRKRADLAYLETHRELERRFPNYHYLVATTREPENLDPAVPRYVGKQYLQGLLQEGVVERAIGHSLDPDRTHVYLCGNPAMIGIPQTDDFGNRNYPSPAGMIELLERRGLRGDDRQHHGNIHFEKYW